MKNFFGRLWTEWTIAISFLREGRTQSMMITIGIAVGVAVIVFISALIQGLQSNIVERTLGTQAHIRLLSPDEVNHIVPPAAGTLQLLQEDQRAQRLRSINNWQQITETLDQLPVLTAVSSVI
ncbi:MAG: ABC transporter permease, partial [Acinetobacter sp.]|nr:ABC transporter permease [Acinetobacter sp.]